MSQSAASPTPPSGLHMPAEWLPHDATWLSWPRNADTWPSNLQDARHEFCRLVEVIAADEPVRVMAGPGDDLVSAERALGDMSGVELVPIQTNDAWARDYAPTFLIHGTTRQLTALGWIYNAWGGKYPPFDDDQRVARRVAEFVGCEFQPVALCIEGGALEVDDAGTILCTRSCAFDPQRNPQLDPAEVERRLRGALRCQAIVWLSGDALIGDDTDGHIDQLARFTPSHSILYAWTDDKANPQFDGLAENLRDLRLGLAALGAKPELVPLPLPDPVFFAGVQIPACYCNFYITNGSVVVPQFGVPQDARAAAMIGEHFPGRRVVSLPSVNLTVGLGSFHCLTQQQPAAKLA